MTQYTEGTHFPSIMHTPLERNGEKVWIEVLSKLKHCKLTKTLGHL